MTFTTLTLAALLFPILATESWADCKYQSNIGGSCYTWNPGVENNCGTGCTYTYDADTKTINITASGNNAKISEGKFGYNYYDGNTFPVEVDNIIIDGQFSSIGMHAFVCTAPSCTSRTISGKDGKLVLPTTGWNTFGNGNTNTLKGVIELSPNVNKIDEGAFNGAKIDGTLIIPDNIKSIEELAFNELSLTEGTKIYCAVENCAEKIIDSCVSKKGRFTEDQYNQCVSNATSIVSNPATFYQAPEGCSYLSAGGCKKCKSNNFKLNDGECDRIRYTPAEAAKVLRDDNTNVVTITFKIQ